jgi:hypothetical protein
MCTVVVRKEDIAAGPVLRDLLCGIAPPCNHQAAFMGPRCHHLSPMGDIISCVVWTPCVSHVDQLRRAPSDTLHETTQLSTLHGGQQ